MPAQDKEIRKLIQRHAREAVAPDARVIDLQFERFRNGWVATIQSRKVGMVDLVARVRQGQWEFELGPIQAIAKPRGPGAYSRAGVDSPWLFALKGLIGLAVLVGLVVAWPRYGGQVMAIAGQVGARLPRMPGLAPPAAADRAIDGLKDMRQLQQNPGR